MTFFKNTFFALLLSIFFFSCAKQPSGFVNITKITIQKYPINKSDGNTWDTATANDDIYPDVHLNYEIGTDPVVDRTVISNLSPRIEKDLYINRSPIYNNLSAAPIRISQDITLGVWDTEDGSLSSSELMSSLTFNFLDELGDYVITEPTTVIVSNDEVTFKLFVTWELDSAE